MRTDSRTYLLPHSTLHPSWPLVRPGAGRPSPRGLPVTSRHRAAPPRDAAASHGLPSPRPTVLRGATPRPPGALRRVCLPPSAVMAARLPSTAMARVRHKLTTEVGAVGAKSALNAKHTASRTKLASHAQRAKDVPVNFS
jgi:hypothetical protein